MAVHPVPAVAPDGAGAVGTLEVRIGNSSGTVAVANVVVGSYVELPEAERRNQD